ncbi:MAG: hypothetical protein KBD60_10890 [Sterolibacterium sp.]|jgi:hypothetical protein|nr:hypothetical protein [Sterolibacterium sp.]
MRKTPDTAPINGFPTKPPVIVANWQAFYEWARDGGYDESYLNPYDSKCLALQEKFLEEIEAEESEMTS